MNHIISFNSINIPCDIIYNISTIVEMAMIKSVLTGGDIVFRDLGKKYDNFKSEIKIETDADRGEVYEGSLKKPLRGSLVNYSGYYPFTPLFDYNDAPIEFVIANQSIKPVVDTAGNVNEYTLSILPAYKDMYSSFTPGTGSPDACYDARTSWSLGGVSLPYPNTKFKTKLNDEMNGQATHGFYSDVDRDEILYLETAEVKVDLSENATKALLYQLLIVSRASDIAMVTPEVFAPFGQQYKDYSNFTVKLYDSNIRIDHINYDQFNITFTLQLIGVV